MKKIKVIAIAMAAITVILCFSGCNTRKGGTVTTTENNAYQHYINIPNFMVYTEVEYDKKSDTYRNIVGSETDENQDYVIERAPIIGAKKGFDVGYNDGDTVTAITALTQLAKARKAKMTFSAGNTLDTITFDGTTHRTASVVNTTRTGTAKRSANDKEEEDIYYIDMVLWEWTVNGNVEKSIANVELKDGDIIELVLKLDNTTKGQNYVFVSDYNAENEVSTSGEQE